MKTLSDGVDYFSQILNSSNFIFGIHKKIKDCFLLMKTLILIFECFDQNYSQQQDQKL
jgi:hypothetical protein